MLFHFRKFISSTDPFDVLPRKVPTSYHLHEENGGNVQMPFIKPTSILKCLLDLYPWLLLGGLQPGRDAQQLLATFWREFKHDHPSHAVYRTENIKFEFTIPLLLHGDGARTLKKQPLEVVSLQPAIGLDSGKRLDLKCRCDSPKLYSGNDFCDPAALRLNSKHNSYLTHFLLFAFPSKKYKAMPGLLQAMLEVMSLDMATACSDGLVSGGQHYRFAILGMKGDLEYHAKTGVLNRSYQNVGHKNPIPCCHECWAGAPTVPFEDFTHDANWKGTLYTDAPWATSPPFHHLPFEDWNSGKAARFFKGDPFHIFRLGIARNFIASAVLFLAFDGFFDSEGDGVSVDARLSRAWSSFSLWCETMRQTTSGIRSFSKEKFHFPTTTSFPWCGCKGSDSIVLIKWLRWFSGLNLATHSDSQALQWIVRACDCGLAFQGIHRHGIFLDQRCRDTLSWNCKEFLHCYARLAKKSFSLKRTLFAMVPKAHSYAHIYHALESSLQGKACNPALYDCSMSEDFVGRVARQSRRLSYRHTVENTLLAYKIKTKLVIQHFQKQRNL